MLERLKRQINDWFSDTSRSKEATKEGLHELRDLIDELIESL